MTKHYHTRIRGEKKNRGVTIFFALLIISLMLGIGTSISLLASKQVSLSTLNKQSELAFYAADSAVECVQYWDHIQDAFNPDQTGSIVINCNKNSITVCDANVQPTCASQTQAFDVPFGDACAHVVINKSPINGLWITNIESYGYNTCSANAPDKLERAIYLSY